MSLGLPAMKQYGPTLQAAFVQEVIQHEQTCTWCHVLNEPLHEKAMQSIRTKQTHLNTPVIGTICNSQLQKVQYVSKKPSEQIYYRIAQHASFITPCNVPSFAKDDTHIWSDHGCTETLHVA